MVIFVKKKTYVIKVLEEHLKEAIKEDMPNAVIAHRRSLLRAAIHSRYSVPRK